MSSGGMVLTGKPQNSERNLSQCHFVHRKSARTKPCEETRAVVTTARTADSGVEEHGQGPRSESLLSTRQSASDEEIKRADKLLASSKTGRVRTLFSNIGLARVNNYFFCFISRILHQKSLCPLRSI